MVAFYKEIQPIDAYTVNMPQPFSAHDQKLLTLFYQPLIGSVAMSLYMTLWADAEDETEEFNHYHLMNVLSLPLHPIFEARLSLEAIGLLRTYTKSRGNDRLFKYELSPPMAAQNFFNDPLLSTFLFSKIGEKSYRSLMERFMIQEDTLDDFKEVTRTFLDVFQPVHQSQQPQELQNTLKRESQKELPFEQEQDHFDFTLFYAGLSEQMVPKASLAKVSKTFIAKLAFLYSLNPIDMQKVVMIALDENLDIQEHKLRKAAAEYYKINTSKTPPVLGTKFSQPKKTQHKSEEKMTREEELVYYLEHTSPKDMLRDLLDGKEPMSIDVELAERLVTVHELPMGVVNVLLQFVFIRNDGKITKNYVERIASHWQNQKVSTAKEALDFSRKEHDKYLQWKNEEKKGTGYIKKSVQKEGVVPDWFYKKDEQQSEQKTPDPDLEERKRKLREELMKPRKEVK